eukprot:Seg4871.2 transcript_id=Seg4871.2/GoldUCD/mRNA.D3Y31 product=Peroxiredoxin-4 protein_id=Seg4871.2/GoldUCD/D3Y31
MARHLRTGLSFFSPGIISAAARGALKTQKTSVLSFSVAKQGVRQINRAYCHHGTMSKAFIQKPAPHFQGTAVTASGEFKDIKLSDYKGKYLVFFFYPLDFTFVCPTEIIAFSDRADEFRAINCEVVACSVDSHFSHLAWTIQPRNKGGLGKMNIPILSDITKQVSKDYGVLLEDQGVSLRGLFIIDDKGTLRQITVNDLPVGRSVDETLRLVQAFQFVDKHGEVCPAGWKPGSDTAVDNVVVKNERNGQKRKRAFEPDQGAKYHLPKKVEKRGRCRHCARNQMQGLSRFVCVGCSNMTERKYTYLCILNQDCFYNFHMQ